MQIENKVVFITGANRGIGKAFAEACAQEKAHLILALRKSEPALIQDLKKQGALSVEIMEADLSSKEDVTTLATKMTKKKIDILFNNAGLLTGGLLESQDMNEIYKMLQVNVNTLIHLTHAIIPQLVKQGSGKIINHSSVSALMHFPCASTYAASKAAVWAFTDCIEQELKGTGVSTLCLITPGIKTRMFDEIDKLYSKNLEVPKDSISPEKYAAKIINAVKKDWTYLEPSGSTAVGLKTALHFRGLFNFGVSKIFKR